MKIYEFTFEIPSWSTDPREAAKVTAALLSDYGSMKPFINISNTCNRSLPLDEARKLARAILALPRPVDAPPEAL